MHLIMDFKNEQQILEFMAWMEFTGAYDFNNSRIYDENDNLIEGMEDIKMAFDYENHLIIVKNK